MENTNRTRVLWIALIVLGLVLSTGLGALAGGAAGFWLGRRSVSQTKASTDLNIPRFLPERTEVPESPEGSQRMPRFRGLMGATVTSVVSGSPAEKAGIQVDDIITAVDDDEVGLENDLRDLISAHKPGDTVEITLLRQSEERTVKVKLGSKSDDANAALLGITYVTAVPRTETPSY